MPAYSFKERFVPMVKDKSKRQTVRAYRKALPRIGQSAHLFYAMRTKHCTRLLPPQLIKQVCTIWVLANGKMFLCLSLLELVDAEACISLLEEEAELPHVLRIEGIEKDRFAWCDGFRPEGSTLQNPQGSFELMYRWWGQTHSLPFYGTVTYW